MKNIEGWKLQNRRPQKAGVALLLVLSTCICAEEVRKPGVGMVGPGGVTEELDRDKNADSTFKGPLAGYKQWKADLSENYGISFGLYAYLLYQYASDSLPGRDSDAFGGIYRFQGNWEAFARDTGHPGRLEWRVEYRSAVGSSQAPTALSPSGALNSGFPYSDGFDADLAVINWTQLFFDKRAGVAVGRLAFDVYLDPYPYQTIGRAYLNRAFVLNPTLATTGIGALGAIGKGFVTEHLWIGGQVYDGNAANGEFDWDTLEENEWLSAAEIGWAAGVDDYKTKRIQLTAWHKDQRSKAGVSGGKGLAFSAAWQMERWLPFLRLGWSDGGAGVAAEGAISMGTEYAVRRDQFAALGIGWADPVGPDSDEYVLEASYRWQVTPGLSVLPDIQLLVDPEKTPAKDVVLIGGLRCILTL